MRSESEIREKIERHKECMPTSSAEALIGGNFSHRESLAALEWVLSGPEPKEQGMRSESEIRQILIDTLANNAQHAVRCGTSPNYPNYTRGFADALKMVLSDPEPRAVVDEIAPLPIESLSWPGPAMVATKLNEVIKAVNEMRSKL